MRAISVILAIMFSRLISFAQDSTLVLSKFEKFYSKTGRMFRTDHGLVGQTNDISVYLEKTTDLQTGDSIKAIRISNLVNILFSKTSVSNLFIDFDEIPDLINALKYLNNEIKKDNTKYEPFYQYVTSNDVVLYSYYAERGLMKGWNVNLYRRYHYSQLPVFGSNVNIRPKEVEQMITKLKNALEVNFK